MSNQIVEELPSAAPVAGGKEKLEKQARQLAYDVKYKVKQQMNRGTNLDPAAVKKAYLAFLGRASGSPQVKALAKKKLIGEGYIDVDQFVQDSVVNALVKEFGGNNEIKEVKNEYLQQLEESEDRKYKIRVTDKQTGNSYVRMATRAKIAELRANTNIASVEMTGYGEPTSTYSSSPSKAKKDYDGDGKVESPTAEYKGSKDKAIKKAMAKEDFIVDAKGEDCGDKKVDVLKKGKKNIIKVMPNIGEDAKYGYDKDGKSLNPDDVKKKNEKDPNGESEKKEEEDYRGMKTKVNLMRNKVRAMGLNMSQKQNGEVIDEAQSSYDKARKAAARRAADRNAQRRAGKLGGRMERETYTSEAGARMHYKGYRANANEEVVKEEGLVDPFYKSVSDDVNDGTGRDMYTKWNNVKNRLRSMGLKMNYELEGNQLIEDAVEYFYEQGVSEEQLDLIVEEVGLDDFVEFVLDPHQTLVEERAAKKASASAPSYEKVKAKVDAGDAARKAAGKGEYATTAAAKRNYGDEEAPEGKPVAKKPAVKKAKSVTPPAKKAETKKKVTTAVKKVKSTQPTKTATKKDGLKDGLRSKITKFVKKGVERHKASVGKAKTEVKKIAKTASATAKQHSQHRKDLVKGLKATPKEKKIAGGIGKAVKKAVTGEEVETKVDNEKQLCESNLVRNILEGKA